MFRQTESDFQQTEKKFKKTDFSEIYKRMNFSKNLKTHMKKNGLTLKDLAKLLNVSQSTVHGWLNGVPPKNLPVIQKLARTLNLSIEELCFDQAEKKAPMSDQIETNLILTIGDQSFKLILKKHSADEPA